MWLPMCVFDGNGFTMACLAVWIRNVAVRWGLSAMTVRSGGWMRRHPTAPVNVTRISGATSGTDFTAPEPDFVALIRAARFCPGSSHLSRGNCRSWNGAWSAPGGAKRPFPKFQWPSIDRSARQGCDPVQPFRTMKPPNLRLKSEGPSRVRRAAFANAFAFATKILRRGSFGTKRAGTR
jgi:hypothetical protein